MIQWRLVLYMLGILDLSLGAAMLLCMGIAMAAAEPDVWALGASGAITLGLGIVCRVAGGGPPQEISHRQGFLIVGLGWLNAAAIGALPFWLGGVLPGFADAFFESASGFTTTGATVLTTIEGLPRGTLLWRSTTQWFGGMGIILLSLAILPLLGVGGMQLYKAEVPGPVPDKLKPRLAETAKTLWLVYVFFTVVETVLLLIFGLGLFDAVSHAFTTLATGGFSTRNMSIGAFQNPYVEGVILFFMLVAGVNFALHYRALTGRPGNYQNNAEFRFFMLLFVIVTAVTSLQLVSEVYETPWEALRFASFQVSSILTTTGFTTADYEKWPPLSGAILFLLMLIGGCAGSTGGGMKCIRILLLGKSAYRELVRLIHPHAVIPLKLHGRTVPQDVMESVWGFFLLFLGIFVTASLVMALLGLDLVSAFVSVAACIGNVGPGLGSVGPSDNYAHIPTTGKWVLSFCMLVGRLEVYTLVLLFVPEFWRK